MPVHECPRRTRISPTGRRAASASVNETSTLEVSLFRRAPASGRRCGSAARANRQHLTCERAKSGGPLLLRPLSASTVLPRGHCAISYSCAQILLVPPECLLFSSSAPCLLFRRPLPPFFQNLQRWVHLRCLNEWQRTSVMNGSEEKAYKCGRPCATCPAYRLSSSALPAGRLSQLAPPTRPAAVPHRCDVCQTPFSIDPPDLTLCGAHPPVVYGPQPSLEECILSVAVSTL